MTDFLRQRLAIIVIAVIVVILLSANRIAVFLTDLWWFDGLGLTDVFTTILLTKIVLGLVFGVLLGLLVAANLMIVRRLRPLFIPETPQQAIVEKYRSQLDPYLPWIIAGIAVVFGLTAAFATGAQWDTFLLWRNAQEFGVEDPQFGLDVGFYVFSLPWWRFVQGWLFTSLLLVTIMTAGGHYLLGGIRPEAQGEKVMPNVKVHLSVLLALILAARGWGYWLDRFMLNYSPRGTVTGASFTDVNAELPALNLLLVVTAVAVVLVLANVRRRGFLLPGAAIALLIVASILLQGAYPAFIQRVRVDPQELEREEEFIARNLEATRAAYDIDGVPLTDFEIENDLDAQQIEEEQVTLNNVRLWDPEILQTTYQELQALRPYYNFLDVDVDRYTVDGELRQVMLASRELDQEDLPSQAQTWQNRTLTYTHGLGVVASRVNVANTEGQPVFLSSGIPPEGEESLTPELPEASIYYGERNNPPYNLVNTEAAELAYETGSEQTYTGGYDGDGGVRIGNWFRRIAFALRFADTNFILSNLINPDSRVLYMRDVQDRVLAAAPYLELDHDPYPVVVGERVLWVQDAYTMSNMYPYSERYRHPRLGVFNYLRNSVKAVVDAYDGTVTLYVADPDDPVIQAWRQAFPAPFAAIDEAPAGLIEHFRYPEDLFTIQAEVYRTYHIPGATAFYNKADAWAIPDDPSAAGANTTAGQAGGATPLEPYYLLMRLPGEQDEEFVLIQPYTALNRPNMISWLAGRSDPEHYGQLYGVKFGSDQSVLGPDQASARIEQEEEISQYITLLDQAGSDVIRGNLLVIPIAESILYVQPLFIESPQAQIPELARVVLVMGDRVAFDRTFDAALRDLVGLEPSDGTAEDPDEGDGVEPDDGEAISIDATVIRALELLARADQALRDGNLGEYQRLVEEARELLEEGAGPAATPDEAAEDGDGAAGGGTDDGAGGDQDAGAEPSPTDEETEAAAAAP